MSTKVYEAWRVKPEHLQEVLAKYKKIMKPRVEEHVFELIQYFENPSRYGIYFSLFTVMHEVFNLIETEHDSPYSNRSFLYNQMLSTVLIYDVSVFAKGSSSFGNR